MSTLVSDPVRAVATGLVHDCGYKSAVLSGIVPNAAHLKSGGYHCSVLDLRAHGNQNDYSNTRANDRDLNVAYGAAVDVSMSKADLVLAYHRCHTVWADRADPRRGFFNAVNVWDGTGDATRLDFDKNTAGYADPSHTFHTHMELHRRFVLDPQAARAMVSMYAGEPKAVWIAREESAPPTPPTTGVTMLPISGKVPELTRDMKDPVGHSGDMITRVQLLLRITPDGDYGKETAAAVAAFNARLGRTTDGSTVDALFWRALYAITDK